MFQRSAWQLLEKHYKKVKSQHMRDWFAKDNTRFEQFSREAAGIFVDYSKQRILPETMRMLQQLAIENNLEEAIDAMFSGKKINTTEDRAVLHTSVRANETPLNISDAKQKMLTIAQAIRAGEWLGCTGKPITDVVNIGIGGSDLGPRMVSNALAGDQSIIKLHFVANIDSRELLKVLKIVSPETTLFIIASKTFTTQETLLNAQSAKNWFLQALNQNDYAKHFIAITAASQKALEFGIKQENILPLWDFIGGRYSLWSTVGLSIAISIGEDNFNALLQGAHAMDLHFKQELMSLPTILALIGIWNINFIGADSLAILPYDERLSWLPTYLQQADMESNGKRVTKTGKPVRYNTAPIIWGGVGTNGQHAFHQLLMQGMHTIPSDLIVIKTPTQDLDNHHRVLVANAIAQANVLMMGRTRESLVQQEVADALISHKEIEGNQPSNFIMLEKLTPKSLGALLALYEHKIFVQGVIWGINSYDQWGVECGKQITQDVLSDMQSNPISAHWDSSTSGLIDKLK